MPVPNTGGQLRTSLAEMQVGDYIACKINNGFIVNNTAVSGSFYSLGDDNQTELPLTGISSTAAGNGKFYFIKSDKGLLIADRVCLHTISWDIMNSKDIIEGVPATLGGILGVIRSLGGGNSYADANGNSSTTDAGLGAWPIDNEWDTYIVKKDYGTGAGSDNVWHYGTGTLTQETPPPQVGVNTKRVRRGASGDEKFIYPLLDKSSTPSTTGFRPVFQYEEVTP